MKHSNIALFIPHNGCPHTCSFCNQKTISGSAKQVSPEEIVSACEQAKARIKAPKTAQIAFFGGSFTAIDREYMLALLKAAKPYAGYFDGIRISTRPDAIDKDILKLLKSFDVKAIELGAQSMDDEVLNANERGHTSDDVRRSAELIKEYGFSLGLQMMTGLFKDSKESVYFTANEFVKLKPDAVRIYPTVVLRETKLYELYLSGEYESFSFDETVSVCADLLELFDKSSIPVIKLGLHASREVEQSMAAGVYHPAFKEFCQSELFRRNINGRLAKLPPGEYTVFIPPKSLSKAAGQRRANLDFFKQSGYRLDLVENPELDGYNVKVIVRTGYDT